MTPSHTTDKQAGRHSSRQADRKAGKQASKHAGRQAVRRTGREAAIAYVRSIRVTEERHAFEDAVVGDDARGIEVIGRKATDADVLIVARTDVVPDRQFAK